LSTRSEGLATKVEQSLNDLLAVVEASTPEQWTTPCTDGEWPQSFAAFHAASTIGVITQTVNDVAEGQPFPNMTMEELDERNAEQAREHANCTKSETVDLIKSAAPGAASMVRSLSDNQLDRKVQLPGGMPEVSVEMLVQMALVGHSAYHLGTITGARQPITASQERSERQ
jgi:DinB superfamily